MILPDWKLKEWALNGGLYPFDPECVNPASIDLRWSGRYRRTREWGWSDVLDADQLIVCPGELVLMDTVEKICMPKNCCGMITLKSSIGRLGLEHMHAGFFDPGFRGTATLEMYVAAPWNVKIERGQRIVQIVMMEMLGEPDRLYNGRYQGDLSPMPTKTRNDNE